MQVTSGGGQDLSACQSCQTGPGSGLPLPPQTSKEDGNTFQHICSFEALELVQIKLNPEE